MTMYATITHAASNKFWYASHIGDTFEVINTAHARVKLRTTFGDFWVEKMDCSLQEGKLVERVLSGTIPATVSETHGKHAGKKVEMMSYGELSLCRWYNSATGRFEFGTFEKNSLILDNQVQQQPHEDMILLGNGFSNPEMIS